MHPMKEPAVADDAATPPTPAPVNQPAPKPDPVPAPEPATVRLAVPWPHSTFDPSIKGSKLLIESLQINPDGTEVPAELADQVRSAWDATFPLANDEDQPGPSLIEVK
jgi:hypothetical protein